MSRSFSRLRTMLLISGGKVAKTSRSSIRPAARTLCPQPPFKHDAYCEGGARVREKLVVANYFHRPASRFKVLCIQRVKPVSDQRRFWYRQTAFLDTMRLETSEETHLFGGWLSWRNTQGVGSLLIIHDLKLGNSVTEIHRPAFQSFRSIISNSRSLRSASAVS